MAEAVLVRNRERPLQDGGEGRQGRGEVVRVGVGGKRPADQLVVALADPSQVAGISPYASDPSISTVANEARAFRQVSWQLESTIPLDPDLVLVGFSWERSLMQQMLRALGFRVVKIDVVSDLAGAYAQIREVAGHHVTGGRAGGAGR